MCCSNILSVSFLGSHSVTFKQWFTKLDKEVQIAEVEAWSRNTSNALTSDMFHGQILPYNEMNTVREFLNDMFIENPSTFENLLDNTFGVEIPANVSGW